METVKSCRLTHSAAADSALYQTALNETALIATALADSALMETALSSVAEPVLPSALKSPQLGRSTCRCSTLLQCPPKSGFRIRIRIHPHEFRSLDPDPGGQKLPTKIEKGTEMSCFEVLDVLL
jgi:hypothetical protein